jgi:hypothetical protein
MRAYLAISGAIFAFFGVLHLSRVVTDWNLEEMGYLIIAGAISIGLAAWAFRLFRQLGRES